MSPGRTVYLRAGSWCLTKASVYICWTSVVALAGAWLAVYTCSTTVLALAGTL